MPGRIFKGLGAILIISANASAKSFTWEDVDQILRDPNVVNRQTLIDRLPDELFSKFNHVLMQKTGSPCESDVDAENPRVLLANEDLAVAYTGKDRGICENIIEFRRARPPTLFKVDFRQGKRPPVVEVFEGAQKNTPPKFYTRQYLPDGKHLDIPASNSNCNRCHGSEAKYIWTRLENAWPNSYGSAAGAILDRDEAKNFVSFIKSSSNKVAYKRLQGYEKIKENPQKALENFYIVPNSSGLSNFDKFAGTVALHADQPVPIQEFFTKTNRPLARKAIDPIFEGCLRCHAGERATGGFIPFDNENQLAIELRRDRGKLFTHLMNRVRSKSDNFRMPEPPERALSEDEINRMANILLKLAPELGVRGDLNPGDVSPKKQH